MSELIDRLDALDNRVVSVTMKRGESYPELRALVLRLEEERGRLQGDVVEKDAIIGPLIEKAKQFEAERDALVEALKGLLTAIEIEDRLPLNVEDLAEAARAALPEAPHD